MSYNLFLVRFDPIISRPTRLDITCYFFIIYYVDQGDAVPFHEQSTTRLGLTAIYYCLKLGKEKY